MTIIINQGTGTTCTIYVDTCKMDDSVCMYVCAKLKVFRVLS